jgi:hypothetical protein
MSAAARLTSSARRRDLPPDARTTCVGGFRTPKQDGTIVDDGSYLQGRNSTALPDSTVHECSACMSGVIVLKNEGMTCGAGATRSGSATDSRGGMYTTMATNFAWHAGTSATSITDCTMTIWPSACSEWYLGCFLNSNVPAGDPSVVSGAASDASIRADRFARTRYSVRKPESL